MIRHSLRLLALGLSVALVSAQVQFDVMGKKHVEQYRLWASRNRAVGVGAVIGNLDRDTFPDLLLIHTGGSVSAVLNDGSGVIRKIGGR